MQVAKSPSMERWVCPRPAISPCCAGQGNVRRPQAIGSEVESNEIRLLRLMLRLEVKAGTAGTRTGFSGACSISVAAVDFVSCVCRRPHGGHLNVWRPQPFL